MWCCFLVWNEPVTELGHRVAWTRGGGPRVTPHHCTRTLTHQQHTTCRTTPCSMASAAASSGAAAAATSVAVRGETGPAAAAAAAAAAQPAAIHPSILARLQSPTLSRHDAIDERQLGVGEAVISWFIGVLVMSHQNTHLLSAAAVTVASAPAALGTPLYLLTHLAATRAVYSGQSMCGIYGRSLILYVGLLPLLLHYCNALVLHCLLYTSPSPRD